MQITNQDEAQAAERALAQWRLAASEELAAVLADETATIAELLEAAREVNTRGGELRGAAGNLMAAFQMASMIVAQQLPTIRSQASPPAPGPTLPPPNTPPGA